MIYLLDTNVCVAALRDNHSGAALRLAKETPGSVALCSVVRAELFYGAFKSQQRAQTFEKLRRFIETFHSYPFDDRAAETYGRIRAALATLGTPIGPNDLMIAAIALVNQLILVTHNTRRRDIDVKLAELKADLLKWTVSLLLAQAAVIATLVKLL